MVERLPEVNEQLLGNIPRLEPVRANPLALGAARGPGREPERRRGQARHRARRSHPEGGGRLRRPRKPGQRAARAVDTLRGRGERYDARVLEALCRAVRKGSAHEEVRELPIAALRVGMVFLEDVKLTTGALLCARGYEVTTSFLARAQNFRAGSVKEPVRVRVPPPEDDPATA